MANDWARLVNTTTAQYLKDAEPLILRDRKLLALMESKGRIKFNSFGTELDWKLEFKEAPLQAFADGDTVTFARRDRYKTAKLPFRAYIMTDTMSQQERLQNRGPAQIVNLYGNVIQLMIQNFGNQFGDQLYVDGNAAGNTRKIHGIESFMGVNTAAQASATGFAQPSDTFADLSTVPGNYGGTWTGSWPQGSGESHYDFYSPILVNYTDATAGAYTATTKTWPNTCIPALRKGITKSNKSKSKSGKLDMILLEDQLFEDLKNAIPQNLQIYRNEKVGLVALGFTDVIQFDGVDITTEFGMPSATGYGFNTMQMEMHSLQDRLFVSVGPTWDEGTQNWRFQLTYYGNVKWMPKFFVKWKDYGANV
jgi:hypothetical protein